MRIFCLYERTLRITSPISDMIYIESNQRGDTMFDIKKFFNVLVRIIGSLFLFIFLTLFIVRYLGQNFGYDINFENGGLMFKNVHFLIAVLLSLVIVSLLNIKRSKFINNDINRSNNDLDARGRKQKTDKEYDYLDDMHNTFVDDLQDDVIDDRYLDFIDEIPRKERFNKSGSLTKKKQKKINHRSQVKVITETLMAYHGGGLYRGSRPVKIKVTNEGLHYGIYFIDKKSIKTFNITEKTEMKVKRSNNPSPLQLLLFGPLSLLFTSTGSQMIEAEGKVLNIDYLENGENHTLLLEGPSAPEVERALREMQSTFS